MENKVLSAESQRISKILGELFKTKREEKGLFQSHVAEKLGITQPYYSMLERGERNIDFFLVWAICRILEIPLSEVEIALLPESERNSFLHARELQIEKCIRDLLAAEYGSITPH